MKQIIKNGVMTGIGIALLTAEKVQEDIITLCKKYSLDEKQGKKLVNDMLKQAQSEGKKFEGMLTAESRAAIKQVKKAVLAEAKRAQSVAGKAASKVKAKASKVKKKAKSTRTKKSKKKNR